MPPKRSTSSTAARNQRSQSTLSFNKQGRNRVTKPASAQRDVKSKKDPALFDITPAQAEPDVEEPTTAEAAIAGQAAAASADPLDGSAVKTEEVLGGRAAVSDAGAVGGKAGTGWKADEEIQARKISNAQIKGYWRKKEQERKAPRVHQEGLSVHEKVLREWDMSGQYGVSLQTNRHSDMSILIYNPSPALVSPDSSDGSEPTCSTSILQWRYWLCYLKRLK